MVGYQIRQVSAMLDVPRNTLIAWERRYDIVEPVRTPAGYRVYTDEHIAILRRVKALIDEGFRVGDACRMVKEELAEGSPNLGLPAPKVTTTGDIAMEEIRDALVDNLLKFDRKTADEVAARLLMMPFERTMEDVYLPVLREIGTRWEHGDASVVQEHFATAWCREKLTVMLHSVQSGSSTAPEVICATPPGEMHELGLLSLSVKLAVRGFRAHYLGPNVPTPDLVEHVTARKPYALCLSMVQGRPKGEIVAYAKELRRRVPAGVKVAIGGRAVIGIPDVEGVAFCGIGLPGWFDAPVGLSRSAK